MKSPEPALNARFILEAGSVGNANSWELPWIPAQFAWHVDSNDESDSL